MRLGGNLNGINVTFGVTAVPILDFYMVSEHSAKSESEQRTKVSMAFDISSFQCSNKNRSSRFVNIQQKLIL